jgi:hypothetical protein
MRFLPHHHVDVADSMLTYHVLIGPGGAVSTDLVGLAHTIATFPAGQYEIMTTSNGALSTTRRWGLAIKHDDGTVELRPDGDSA